MKWTRGHKKLAIYEGARYGEGRVIIEQVRPYGVAIGRTAGRISRKADSPAKCSVKKIMNFFS